MSGDKNKSYQDGLYNQPYNGRNWDQWVAGNNARGSGQNNYYTGPKSSSIQWPSASSSKENAGEGNGGGASGLLFLILIPVIIVGIGVVAASAILAIIVTPLLKLAERLFGAEERKSLWAAYMTTVKALSAYGITAIAENFLIHLLARQSFSPGIVQYIAFCINSVVFGIFHGAPIPLSALIGANIIVAPLGLAGFGYVLSRDYRTAYSGVSGFLRAMIVGIPLVGVSLVLAGLVYALVMY
jgi:hypothetical protein